MKTLHNSAFLGLAASFLLMTAAMAQGTTPTAEGSPSANAPLPVEPGPAVQLPKLTVIRGRLADFPLIAKGELSGGGLAPSEPPANLQFPGVAYSAGISKGYAAVCVELDEKGNATDFLLVAYTEKYFGEALLRHAREAKYSPLLFQGVPVPSRFDFSYEFRPEFSIGLSSFEAVKNRQKQISGDRPEYKLLPVIEEELDNRLEHVRQAVPYFPDGYVPAGGKRDWVLVSLYIDEEGQVRVPRVESASSSLLVGNALKAVRYWQFKPPTAKGKPVIVFAAFAVNFLPAPK